MAKKIIKCPYCGYEYLPAEIFYPKTFLGEPYNIIRDENGVILGYQGTDMNTLENYSCDNCSKQFSVESCVSFKSNQITDIFEDDDSFFNEV